MAKQYGRVRSLIRGFAPGLALSLLTLGAGACGKGIFSFSSSSSSGGGSTTTTRSVYVSNFGDGLISSLNLSSAGLRYPLTISGGAKNGPIGLAVTPKKTALYAANAADDLLYEFTLSSNGNLSNLGTIATGPNPQQPVVTPNGSYAYSVDASGSIYEYTVNPTSGLLSANSPSSTRSGLVDPISAVAANSYLYVTDQNGGKGVVLIFKINSSGTLASGPASVPSLGIPGGPAAPNQLLLLTTTNPTQNWLFVSDAQSGVISLFQITNNGSKLTFVNSYATYATTPNLAEAGLLYVKSNSNIFIYCADQTNDTVSVFLFTTAPLALTRSSVSPSAAALSSPTGLAYAGDNLYVTNNGNGTITRFDISTTTAPLGALSNPASFNTESPANSLSAPEAILITN